MILYIFNLFLILRYLNEAYGHVSSNMLAIRKNDKSNKPNLEIMKVSNCSIAKATAYSIIGLMIFISICIIINSRTLIDSMLIFTIILLIFALTKVKMIVYEFSGGCVTIRKTYPFSSKKFIAGNRIPAKLY